MSTPTSEPSLYEQLGGKPAINAAVELFYAKVLADVRINHYFASIDIKKQIGMQRDFLTTVFGGPTGYSGQELRKGHSHLQGLNDTHFDAVIENLGQTLSEMGVKPELVQQVLAIAESVRGEVLNR